MSQAPPNEAEQSVTLDELSILDSYGAERMALAGNYTAEQLANYLADLWVPFVQCGRKCSRSDYCRYVYSEGETRYPNVEVRCGVCAESLRMFVKVYFGYFLEWNSEEREAFLDAAFYLTSFVGCVEFGIGFCSDEETVEYWSEAAPLLFTTLIRSRDSLNCFASSMRLLPETRSLQSVLLVEGKTEKVFLDTLKRSHLSHFLRLTVKSYNGKPNKRAKRIEMLLKKYEEDGYTVYLQGDADGEEPDSVFEDLIRRDLVKRDHVFVFSVDFETGIPFRLLFRSLKGLGFLDGVLYEDFAATLTNRTEKSILGMLSTEYAIPIDSVKPRLARQAAMMLSEVLPRATEAFMQTELGGFLSFVQGIWMPSVLW